MVMFISLFYRGSKKKTAVNMKKAKTVQSKLSANYGGTEMVAPFKDMYTWKRIDGYQRQVNIHLLNNFDFIIIYWE